MTGAREQSTRGGQTRSEGKGGETGRGGHAGLLPRFEIQSPQGSAQGQWGDIVWDHLLALWVPITAWSLRPLNCKMGIVTGPL